MRRLLRDIAQGDQLGDTTTLADAGVVELIRESSSEDRGVGPGAAELPAEEEVRTRRRPPARGHRRRARPQDALGRSGVAFDGLTEEWRLVGRMERRRPPASTR